MKILMLLSNPFMVDPRVHKEAKALVDEGNEVTVVVWDRRGEYGQEDVVDGIRIVRIHNTGLMKVMPNDLFRNPLWWRRAYKKGLELHKNGFDFGVVHCHDLDTLQSGVWLKKKIGCKLVYDAHEIFGYMISRDMPKIIVNAAFWMEKRLIRNVAHIITVNEPFEDYLKSISDKPITIVMNCKDLISDYQPPKSNIFTIVYIGILHRGRFFPQLVDIIGNIDGVKFIIAGKKENIYEEVKERCRKYDNVEFLGTIPFNEVIPKTLKSNAIIAIIDPKDVGDRWATLNKQFEAMVCGRPIICTEGTYSGETTDQLKCGLTVGYNGKSIKEAIINLRDNPKLCEELGKNGLKAAKEKYNWKNQREKLLKIYEEII